MMKLEQKVAVITGGARGIGQKIALTFAEEGADIVIGDVSNMEVAAHAIQDLGRKVVTVKTDISKKEEVQNLIFTALDSFRKVDILVNDAGIQRRSSLLDMTEKNWDDVINVNLKGVFLCTQAAAKHMVERKYGKIINIASIVGLAGLRASVNYVASKSGVVGLTRICARDLGPYGINVNAIAAGVIVTDMTYMRPDPERFIEEEGGKAVLGRTGTPQDIANLALFLASDESSFITGQVIASDGGRIGVTQ